MQSPASLEEFVLTRIAQACHLDRSAVSPETNLLGIGLDSLTQQSIISQVETSFDVEFTADETFELFNAECVCDFVRIVQQLLARASAKTSPAANWPPLKSSVHR
jgi:acyl carrier protein